MIRTGSRNTNGRRSRKYTVFFFCLIISAIGWFLTALAGSYTEVVYFRLRYENLPEQLAVSGSYSDSLKATVKTSGYTLTGLKYGTQSNELALDFSRFTHKGKKLFYITSQEVSDLIAKQFPSISVVKLFPDSLFLNFEQRITKKVPVKADLKISYDADYGQADSIRIKPVFVTITGPKDEVEQTAFIATEPIARTDLDKTLSEKVPLTLAPGLVFSDSTVSVEIPVEAFSEKVIELDVTAVNLPQKSAAEINPKKVTLKFSAPEAMLEKLKPEDFRAVIDASKRTKRKSDMRIIIAKKPAFVKLLGISPAKTEVKIK